MSIDKFRQYDLNLLLVLLVLLEEEGVTATAKRLGVSQGAVSRSLARLRGQLDDELLVRVGSRMVPTPRALSMKEPLEEMLHGLGLLLEPEEDVVPEQLDVEFSLEFRGVDASEFLPTLLLALRRSAPSVRLRVTSQRAETARRIAHGDLDLVVSCNRDVVLSGLIWQRVLRRSYKATARVGGPIPTPMDAHAYLACEHVAVAVMSSADPVDVALGERGHERNVRVVVPSYVDAAQVALSTDLVATIPLSSTAALVGLEPHSISELLPAQEVLLGWHERTRRDPAHRWFRELVYRVLTEMEARSL